MASEEKDDERQQHTEHQAPAWPKLLVSVTRLVIRNPRNSGKTPSTPDNAPKTIASTIACFQIHALADAPY